MNTTFNTFAKAVALAAALYAPMVAAPAVAGQTTGIEVTYYSDATKTVIVGTFTRTCEGHIVRTGVVTSYFDSISETC